MPFIYHNALWSSNDSNNFYGGYIDGNSYQFIQEQNKNFNWKCDHDMLMSLSGMGNLDVSSDIRVPVINSSNISSSNLTTITHNIVSSNGKIATVQANSNTSSNYSMVLPTHPPADSNFINFNSSGIGTFLPNLVSNIYNGSNSIVNTKIWVGTATTNSGTATFYPTIDGTSNTASAFNSIIFASAMATNNTTSAINVPICGLKTISGDRRTLVFNVVQGNGVLLGGNSMVFSGNGLAVNCFILGT
jgi:hypothetical protein